MKFIISITLAIILSGCTSFPAAVLPEVTNGVPQKIPLNNSKQLYLSGVKTRLENTSVGQMTIGNACLNEKEFKWANNAIWDGIFRDSMIAEFSKHEFNMPQNTLEYKNQEDAKVLLGARMVNMAANICNALNGFKGDAVITIEWTVFDKTSDKTSILTTYGKGHVPSLRHDGAQELFKEAASDAARNLMSLDDFSKLVRKNNK